MVASKLLQHHILEQLQEIVDILRNTAVLPPTCLGEEPDNPATNSRTLTRAASLRGGVGAPGSPSTPPTRFFTEKKIPHECLVMGAIESAFKEMVCISRDSEVLVAYIESHGLEKMNIWGFFLFTFLFSPLLKPHLSVDRIILRAPTAYLVQVTAS